MRRKFIFTYQTKCKINGKTYVGVHTTDNINDGYIGCGVFRQRSIKTLEAIIERAKSKKEKHSFPSAVLKHGVDNFEREILCFFDTVKEAYEEEAFLVDTNWIKSDNNYNICLGGLRGPANFGKDNHKYRGEIYIVNKITGEVIGKYSSANEIKRKLGLHQAIISKTLRGESTGLGDLFFTRDIDNWIKELEEIKKDFKDKMYNIAVNCLPITAYNLDGTIFKRFPSKAEACRFLGKSKHGVSYLDDVLDKTNQTTGLPLIAWGYNWKRG